MNTLIYSCGSFVELSLAFRSLSGENLALASHSRMGQSHIFSSYYHVLSTKIGLRHSHYLYLALADKCPFHLYA